MLTNSTNIQTRKVKGYGWKRPLPSPFRPKFSDIHDIRTNNPPMVDLSANLPKVLDQKDIGSCVDNSVAALIMFLQKKNGKHLVTPSRLFLYYNARSYEGTVKEDSGSSVEDGIHSAAQYGYPPESEWWYNTKAFAVKPPKKIYADAKPHVLSNFHSVDSTNLNAIRTCLANGTPISVGFTVYESFESDAVAKSGIVPMPKKGEQVLGGHCTLLFKYDDNSKLFTLRNSWGPDWGQGGNFQMPYAYLTNKDLADDFWTALQVS